MFFSIELSAISAMKASTLRRTHHNLGVDTDQPTPDVGRFEVTKDPKDWGAFKTPELRDVARSAPYMRDGSLKTLEEVVEFYDKGGKLIRTWTKRSSP